jgi:preprotein translocase SecF subunit
VFDVVGRRRWFFLFSALITIPGLIFIFLTPITNGQAGLKFSIDYTGGTRWQIHFADPNVTTDGIKAVLTEQDLGDSTVQELAGKWFDIKTKPIGLSTPPPSATPPPTLNPSELGSPSASASAAPSASASASGPSPSSSASGSAEASASASGSANPSASASASVAPSGSASAEASASASTAPSASPSASESAAASASPSPSASPAPTPTPSPSGPGIPTSGKLGEVATALQAKLGPIDGQRQLTTVGPVVSADLINQAIALILVGALGILIWITFRFHDVKFGVTALVALLHDVIVVVGTFAVLGTLFGIEIDALFVTAMLTVIGFSVHDTIVVFDRIRENKARHAGEPFAAIVNHSVLQTFGRSINTSLTVVLTLMALFLFGGSAIRIFVLALLLGIISGTYSSIFNASPLLVVWQEWEDRRKARLQGTRTARRASA